MATITSQIIKDFARRTKFINTTNTALPICSSIVLDYTGENLKIYKTNCEKSAVLTVGESLQIEGEGRYLIEEKELVDFATERGPVITITQSKVKSADGKSEQTFILLQCGIAKRKFPVDNITLFPNVPEMEGDTFEIGSEVVTAIKIASTFTSKEETQIWMQHVIFQGAHVFATDQFKMYRHDTGGELPVMELPAAIVAALPDSGIVSLSQNDNTIFCEIGELAVSALKQQYKITGRLNDYMMNKTAPCMVKLEKQNILPIINMAEKSGSKNPEINIAPSENGMRIWAYAEDKALEDEDFIACEISGKLSPVCVNAVFLKQSLFPFTGDIVLQDFPGLLKIEDGNESVVLYKIAKNLPG